MNAMNKGILTALALAGIAGCGDPFNAEPGGTPQVIGAGVTEGGAYGAAYEATASGTAWTATAPATCAGGVASVPGGSFAYLKMNKLLDGYSVQTTESDCTPAGNWLTVTPAAPAGKTWYSCYNPGSPTPTEASSIMIFLADTSPVASGWISAGEIPASGTATTTYHFTGPVKDKSGTEAGINLTVNVAPDPGTPTFDPFTNKTATSLTVNWTAVCDGSTYSVDRAPDVAGAPGTYTNLATGLTVLTYDDTGLTANTAYWYRVTASVSGNSAAASVTTAP